MHAKKIELLKYLQNNLYYPLVKFDDSLLLEQDCISKDTYKACYVSCTNIFRELKNLAVFISQDTQDKKVKKTIKKIKKTKKIKKINKTKKIVKK